MSAFLINLFTVLAKWSRDNLFSIVTKFGLVINARYDPQEFQQLNDIFISLRLPMARVHIFQHITSMSSTYIRLEIANFNFSNHINANVLDYIRKNGLYSKN